MINTHAVAWAAGLFEGEGCVSVPKVGSRSRPRVLLTSTDHDVIVRFAQVVRVGNISGPHRHKGKPTHKPFWTWSCGTFEGMQAVAAFFWGHLGTRRKARMKSLLVFLKDRPRKRRGDGAYCNARLTVDDVRAIRSLAGAKPQTEVAAMFRVSQGTVSDIQVGKTWSSVPQELP